MEHEKYVLVPFSDYQKLNLIAGIRRQSMLKINIDDMLFLGKVIKKLSIKGYVTLYLADDTARITVEYPNGGVADTVFAIDTCKMYYNDIDKFITVIF